MPLSDSSGTCTRVVRPRPSPAGLLASCPAGIPEVSRFSCLKFLGVQGSSTTQGWRESRTIVSRHVAFRRLKGVGTLIGCFRSSIALPTYTSVYASLGTSRCPVQNSRPSGSLLLSRKALSSSASDRFIPALLNSNKSTRWAIEMDRRRAACRGLSPRLLSQRQGLWLLLRDDTYRDQRRPRPFQFASDSHGSNPS